MLTTALRVILSRSFRPFVFTDTYDKRLEFENLPHLGLYVHIPFCRSLCAFCPYCKVPYDPNLVDDYVEALLAEIHLVGKESLEKKIVTSLYFGGGTPALLIDSLEKIISCLKEYFIITEGIGVELHPNDITKSNLEKLRNMGITMVSIGVQSFHSGCLENIGRENHEIQEKIRLVKSSGFAVIDIDLIFALPGQDEKVLRQDMEMAFALGATQVSTYPFIDFSFADNPHPPLSERRKREMLKTLADISREMGLVRTSVWTFAQPETGRYTSVTRDCFLGFGVSATTLLKDSFKVNTFSVPAYIDRIRKGELATALTCRFTLRQRALYFLFWSAYSLRVNSMNFQEILGVSLESLFAKEFWLAEKLGLVVKKEEDYLLTEKGASLYHDIEQRYTHAYIDKTWRLCRREPFPKEMILR